jgi:preprotein translocase subunit SecG
MQAVLIVIHLLIAISLIFVIMLQRSEGGALGMGGGGSGLGGLFSPRGAANTLTKTTVILGVLFFVTSLTLTLMSLGTRQANSPLLIPGVPGAPTAPAAPGAPGAPPTLPSLPGALPAPGPPAGGAPSPAPAAPAPAAPAVPPAAK